MKQEEIYLTKTGLEGFKVSNNSIDDDKEFTIKLQSKILGKIDNNNVPKEIEDLGNFFLFNYYQLFIY